MTRRSWMLALAMLSLTAGGVWAGLALACTRTTKGGDTALPAASTKTAAKTSCCCDDPTCPPGCTPECAAECLPAAKTNTNTAMKTSCYPDGECCSDEPCCGSTAETTKATVVKKYICPPCPFCPGW